MIYILDTDFIIYFLKANPKVIEAIANIPQKQIATTIINQTELLFGAFNSIKKKENIQRIESFLNQVNVIAFSKESAYIFAEQKALLNKQGNIIADLDLMIAAITLQQEAILVTNNTKHFSRIKKLAHENWSL